MNSLLEQQSFRLILNALHDGVAIYDREGTLLWVNEKVCQMFALPRTELIGRNVRDIVALPALQSLVTAEVNGRPRTATGTYSVRIEDYGSPGYLVFANGRQVLYTLIHVPDEHGNVDQCRCAVYRSNEQKPGEYPTAEESSRRSLLPSGRKSDRCAETKLSLSAF